ncbi:MAG: prolipoprotein diacylglyceryl transferase [Alphaproteobacteria bacterium]|nr:prolipoprotein diacylglyceryl transferase [Alphaproteobacteria bacterium]USO07653.1 MAG: prolipoprotein diacylglyceryl transferase [Rhodospirillales bacterium]
MIFPQIDPIAFSIGPLQIHWYALAYLTGFLGGWAYATFLLKHWGKGSPLTPDVPEDILPWIIAGVILGGRIVYTIVYNPILYLNNPGDIVKIWQGGMSFHGGLLGVLSAIFIYGRRKKYPFLALTDMAAAVVPIGLFFGRIANFVNSELWGRTTTLPWGIVFPDAGPLPRHPSQLYEAGLEGLALFFVLMFLARRPDAWRKHGLLSGTFLIGYAISRILVECVREPDAQIGFLPGGITMGQVLSVPMLLAGAWIVMRWKRSKP